MTIDESMIKSKSRFVNFKQYMPLKPIKHGIKVFVLACGCSRYVYNWDVFQGRSSTVSGALNLVVGRLITGNLIGSKRILYTDNYYTSIALAVTLYCLYGIYLVGTYAQKKNAKMTENAFRSQSSRTRTPRSSAADGCGEPRAGSRPVCIRRKFNAFAGRTLKFVDL